MRKKGYILVMIISLFGILAVTGLAVEPDGNLNGISPIKSEDSITSYPSEKGNVLVLDKENDIQYYAYLDLNDADESLRNLILEARKNIIMRQSWVSDGSRGYVYDERGNVIEEVPQFHDLFPADWEEPILSTKIDLSYYKR